MSHTKNAWVLGFLLLTVSPSAYADSNTPPPKWDSWVDAETKLGNNRSLGIVDAFAPVWQNQDSLIFFNPRFRFDDQDSREYNIGFGYRTLTRDWVLGAYGFVDENRSPSNNYFTQATLGAEALGTDWKFRVNDYQPLGDRHHLGSSPTVIASGGTLMISGGIETSLQGNDAEVGYRIPLHDANSLSQLWVYGGAYRFDAPDTEAIAGPRIRAEYNIGGVKFADHDVRLRLSGEIEHDSVRDTNYFAGLRVGIPFGAPSGKKPPLSPLERHMIDPVERDVDIVTGAVLEPAINPLSGNTVSSVVTLPSGHGIQARIDAAGNNAVIVLDGSNGDFVNSESDPDPLVVTPFVMHDGQVFIGSGGSIALRGAHSGVTAAYNPGGTPATFNGGEWIELARNNAISGLTLTGMTNSIFSTADVGNFSLTHTTISGTTSVSSFPVNLALSTPTTITIDHNSFLNNTVGAVRVALDAGVTSAQLTYTDNIATNNGSGSQSTLGSAFTIIANGSVGPTTLTMSGNTVTGNDKAAFYAHTSGAFSSFTGTFTDNDFSNNGNGITFATDANTASFTITGNTLANLQDNAIAIIPSNISNLDLVVDHNEINNIANASNGIAVQGVTNQLDMQITNNTISNTEGTAITNYNGGALPDIHAVISNNTIENNQNLASNAAGGIDIEGFNSLDLTMDSNTLNNNTGGSIVSTSGFASPSGATNVTFTNNGQTGGDAFNMVFDGNGAACANIHDNTSTTANAYNLTNAGTGTFTLAPADYASVNTGGFTTTGTIGSAASCP